MGVRPLVLVFLLAACSGSAGPETVVERDGVVRWFASAADVDGDPTWPGPDDVVVDAPETVTAGETFEVVVRTVGNSGCWELAFTEPGEATIRVVGRLVVGEDFSQGEEFVVERAVTVEP